MSRRTRDLILLLVSIVSFVIFSANIVGMYTEADIRYESKVNVVSGVVFWATLLVCIFSLIFMYVSELKWCHKHGFEKKKGRKPAVICFFSNKFAAVADVMLIISVVGLLITLSINGETGLTNFIITATVIFSFWMHCLLNSVVFYFVINQDKIVRKLNRRRENMKERKIRNEHV